MSEAAALAEPLIVVEGEARTERWARLFGPVVIAACTLTAYANSFGAPFVFDGLNYLKEGTEIRQLWPLHELLLHVKSRPVGFLSFALSYALFEYDLIGWHLTNLLIHTAAACALFGISRRTFASPRLVERYGLVAARLGLAVALVWAVHPLCTQCVTYLYQRLESLMGMFYLFTLYAFVRYAEGGKRRWAAASLLSCLLAMATKEVAVTAPLMVLWYDRTFWSSSWRELGRRRGVFHLLLWLMLTLPGVLIGSMLEEYPDAGILDTRRTTVWQYTRTQPQVVQHYLRLAIIPVGQNLDYAWPIAPDDWRVYGPSLVFIAGLVMLTLLAAWGCPPLGFVGAWWFVILAPTSSFAPIVDLAFEHRTYLSLIAVAALAVFGIYEAIGALMRRCQSSAATTASWRFAAFTVLIATLTSLTLWRNHDYRTELAIWRDVRFKVPHNPRGHYNYGVYLQIDGSPELVEEAIREYKETIRLDPNYELAYLNLGNLAAWKEEPAVAELNYREVLRINPDHLDALVGLGDALMRLNRPEDARPYIEHALRIDPNHSSAKLTYERLVPSATSPSATDGTTKP